MVALYLLVVNFDTFWFLLFVAFTQKYSVCRNYHNLPIFGASSMHQSSELKENKHTKNS